MAEEQTGRYVRGMAVGIGMSVESLRGVVRELPEDALTTQARVALEGIITELTYVATALADVSHGPA